MMTRLFVKYIKKDGESRDVMDVGGDVVGS